MGLSWRAIIAGAAIALLAGCGGSQPPIGAPGAMPQSRTIVAHNDRSGSWMLPEAKSDDLLYVYNPPNTLMLSYPGNKVVGMIKEVGGYMCSDTKGDVFMTGFGGVLEYAHGGTTPIQTLQAPSLTTYFGCSVDPTTGNLAVTAGTPGSPTQTYIAIYQGAQGSPQLYSDATVDIFYYCGYDDQGNLFASGVGTSTYFVFTELPKGSSTFTDISLPPSIVQPLGQVQWDGSYITLENPSPPIVYRIAVSGSTGTIVGTVKIRDQKRTKHPPYGFTWIQGDQIISAQGAKNEHLGFWNYPAGGSPTKIIRDLTGPQHRHIGSIAFSAGTKR